jgi:hypothetical protein
MRERIRRSFWGIITKVKARDYLNFFSLLTVSFLRPFDLLRLRIFLPSLVFDLLRNPWVLVRFLFFSLPNMFFDQLMISGLD